MTSSAIGWWRRPRTRIIFLALAAVAAIVLEGGRKPVEAAAWCLMGGDSGRSCGYHTMEQCMASRAGGSSHCAPNPNEPGNQSPSRTGSRR
jgi:hypothetical protein